MDFLRCLRADLRKVEFAVTGSWPPTAWVVHTRSMPWRQQTGSNRRRRRSFTGQHFRRGGADRGGRSGLASLGLSARLRRHEARPFGPRRSFNGSALRASPRQPASRAIAPVPTSPDLPQRSQHLHDHCSQCLSAFPGWPSRFQSNSTVAATNRK